MLPAKPDDFALGAPYSTAIYLPAVNTTYPKIITKQLAAGRSLPTGLKLDDLAFWTGSSELWNHKFLLHSVGGYEIGSDPRGPLFSRAKGSFVMVGDSGGFQIGKGTMQGLKGLHTSMTGNQAVAAWNANYDAKIWLIDWLEHYCNYAMTIDMPLFAMLPRGKASPFHHCTEAQLLNMTVENLKLIESERSGRAKWLNVIQGTDPENARRWWNGVKWFKYGGWSLAGFAGWRGGIHGILTTILLMRDEQAFDPGQDWMHVLGVSQPTWDVLLTGIQRELRNINPNLQISCDSSTPFQAAGVRDEYMLQPALGKDTKDWRYQYATISAVRSRADASHPTPFGEMSPLGQRLDMHHLVVKSEAFTGRRIDSLSNALLANHNMWVMLDTGRRANQFAFCGGREQLPNELSETLDLIADAFKVEHWQTLLNDNRNLLDSVAPAI